MDEFNIDDEFEGTEEILEEKIIEPTETVPVEEVENIDHTGVGDKEEPEKGSEELDAKEEFEVDELTLLKEQNAKLLAAMENFAETKISPTKIEDKKEEIADNKTVVKEAIKEEILEFLGPDDDIDEILANKNQTNALLLKVLKAAKPDVEQLKTNIREEILTTLPQVVLAQVQQQITLKKTVDEFMGAHEGLQPVRKTVGIIASQVASEHPEWALVEVLKESAARAYTMLGIKQKTINKEKSKGGDDPSFIASNGVRQKVGNTKSALQKEIEELLD